MRRRAKDLARVRARGQRPGGPDQGGGQGQARLPIQGQQGTTSEEGDHGTDEYYDFFKNNSNQGRVFFRDMGALNLQLKNLTVEEIQDRLEWNDNRSSIQRHYYTIPDRNSEISQQDVLNDRVVPPNLTRHVQSSRYFGGEARNPIYPKVLNKWDSFEPNVAKFTGSSKKTIQPWDCNAFKASLVDSSPKADEKEEQAYLKSNVIHILAKAGLMPALDTRAEEGSRGLLDIQLQDEERLRVAVEVKSTHSLALPMAAKDVVQRFNKGASAEDGEAMKDQLYVTYTIGQLLRYMLLNGCRYGVLTSGTRSYFVKIEDVNTQIAESVFISNALHIGQKDYLRAWAYIYSMATKHDAFFTKDFTKISWAPKGSEKSESEHSKEPKPGESQGSKNKGKSSEKKNSSFGVKHVSLAKIKFGGVLGHGRNGCVMRATWEGKEIALKQFDCGRKGVLERFQQEVEAYERLKAVQGILVPNVFFVSELPGFGIKYLGLQLGRDPTEADLSADGGKSFESILSYIEFKYGMVHMDTFQRNGLVVSDESGKDRLVVIDWEEYTWSGDKEKFPKPCDRQLPNNLIVCQGQE